jgi:outer membrane phospholipase A
MNRPFVVGSLAGSLVASVAALVWLLPAGAKADPAPAAPTPPLPPLPDAAPTWATPSSPAPGEPAAPAPAPAPPPPAAPAPASTPAQAPPEPIPAPPLPAPPATPPGLPVSTPTTDTSKSFEGGEMVRAPGAPARTAIPERVSVSADRQYFFLHDDNYIAGRVNNGWPPRVKFQFSIRFEILEFFDHFALNAAYTQTSFWDLFAFDRSSPFVESDYRPEGFLSFRPWKNIRYRELQLGAQHQSNGLGNDFSYNQTANSRSWNYVFVDGRWGFGRDNPRQAWFFLTPGVRAWIPFGFTDADNNGFHLPKYEGYVAGMLDVDLRIPDHPNFGRLSARFVVRQHNQQADLFYPIYGKVRCWVFGQYFHGQAERLITVADTVNAIYLGLGFQ